MTHQPEAITKVLHWQDVHQGKLAYDETASTRLDWETHDDLLTPTDCSGNIARLIRHFTDGKVNIGTYTGNECSYGTLVTVSKSAAGMGYGMLPGDCILFDWPWMSGDAWSHIAMYIGNGRIWNHGGPGRGPVSMSLADNVAGATKVMVRRFLPWPTDTVTHPPIHHHDGDHHPSPNPMHGHSIPALIARGTGDYYGLITGPNRSHGGAYKAERPVIKLIQSFLNWKMNAGLKVDGIFAQATRRAVAKFQDVYEPGTEFYGQVWFDDWLKMASL